MHQIEPYSRWLKFYDSAEDPNSPFFGKEYNYDLYSENIYGYYIDPGWDFFGSETLYLKVLYVNYHEGYIIIEFLGEWNDALNNDIMHLKRNIIEHFLGLGITRFILIGENILNFHGSDDCYYEEWFEEVEDGWIVALNFRDFIESEMAVYAIDQYVNFGGQLQMINWRTMTPMVVFEIVNNLMQRRLPA
ncbi:hypothetical protein [Marinoscillum sp. MHG1-6]|uniref:hypothetical protein n=1 Tax=Marinoscillum sp. MHG1-6 TaxID=2959627 RepID=UPI0021577184|nr:hypothetical protein [Marinoscillum sp. MHG1-6]